MIGMVDSPYKVYDRDGNIYVLDPEKCLNLNIDLDALAQHTTWYNMQELRHYILLKVGGERCTYPIEDLQ